MQSNAHFGFIATRREDHFGAQFPAERKLDATAGA